LATSICFSKSCHKMHYASIVTIVLTILIIVMKNKKRKQRRPAAGNVSLMNNIVKLSRKRRK